MVNVADEPLNKNFAPLVTMLQIPRQRGGAGAEFRALDAHGKPLVIVQEGFAKEKRLDVQARDKRNRIARAAGDLVLLDALPAEAFSDAGRKFMLAVITNPEAHFTVASDEHIAGGILKMAFHFFAGFVADISVEDASKLLPYILGEKPAGGECPHSPTDCGHFVGGGASGNNVGIAVAVGVYTPGQAAGGFSWGFGPYGPFHALPKYGRCTK